MAPKTGRGLLNSSLIDRENNADKDGSIIWTPALTKGSGQMIKNGFYFCSTLIVEIDGLKFRNTFQVEQIIILKIIGIRQCVKKFQLSKICLKVIIF